MTIREIIARHRAAQAMLHSLDRARLMLHIQRAASNSRSRFAPAIEADAHLAAVMALRNLPEADQPTRSELGRIKAESQHMYNGRSAA